MREGTASDLSVGTALPFSIFDTNGKLMLSRGTAIKSESQMERLISRGFLIRDEGPDAVGAGGAAAANEPVARRRELPVFDAVRELALKMQNLHQQLLGRRAADLPATLKAYAVELDALAERDTNAALASMQLLIGAGDFGARHVHAAILCRVLCNGVGMTESQRLSTVAAALVHDVGLTPIVDRLNQQTTPLTPAQRAQIAEHPAMAAELLRVAGVEDDCLLRAVLEHHERLDGSGYPMKLSGDEISVSARVLSIVDTYSAMVRPRAYREAVHSKQALRDIFVQRAKSEDERMASLFISLIGMYPPGSLVKLATGETAVVTRRGERPGCPEARVVYYANGGRALAHPHRNTCDIGCEVIESLPMNKHLPLLGQLNKLWIEP